MSYDWHVGNPSDGCASELNIECGARRGREAMDVGNSPKPVHGLTATAPGIWGEVGP